MERPLIVTLEERFTKAKSSDVASDIPDVFFPCILPTQSGREYLYLTFHSWMPAENFSCSLISRRRADVLTGLKWTMLYVSFSTP
jgi:hypothetical protein